MKYAPQKLLTEMLIITPMAKPPDKENSEKKNFTKAATFIG